MEFLRPHENVTTYELLPFHSFGEKKYQILGKNYELEDLIPPTTERMKQLQQIIDEKLSRKE